MERFFRDYRRFLCAFLSRRALSTIPAAHSRTLSAHSVACSPSITAAHSTDNRRRGRWMQRRTAPPLLHSDDRPADTSVAAGHRTRTDCGLLRRTAHRSVSPIWKEALIEAARQPEASVHCDHSDSPFRERSCRRLAQPGKGRNDVLATSALSLAASAANVRLGDYCLSARGYHRALSLSPYISVAISAVHFSPLLALFSRRRPPLVLLAHNCCTLGPRTSPHCCLSSKRLADLEGSAHRSDSPTGKGALVEAARRFPIRARRSVRERSEKRLADPDGNSPTRKGALTEATR